MTAALQAEEDASAALPTSAADASEASDAQEAAAILREDVAAVHKHLDLARARDGGDEAKTAPRVPVSADAAPASLVDRLPVAFRRPRPQPRRRQNANAVSIIK